MLNFDQSLIDKMGYDNISDGENDLLEEEGMFLVDEDIEDLTEAQDDLLYGSINESGRLIDLIDPEIDE